MFSDDLSDLSDWSDESNSNSEYESYLAGSGEEEDSVIPIRLSSAEKNAARDKEKEPRSQLGESSLQPGSSSSNVSPEMTVSALK